jgi:FtsH-binding integral membrane protein
MGGSLTAHMVHLVAGNRVQLDPDDYILASLQLYLDIINLFIYILRIINESRRD